MLDPIQQRVLGVLIEKELSVPDTYPLTEAALLAGCNQKSNRDPEMELQSREIHDALVSLREAGWVTRIDTSARSTRYRHEIATMLGLDRGGKAVLCELLVRGPQAPGALKPRVARLGFHAEPHTIRDLLERLAHREGKGDPLVEEQPRRPRERDQRWSHLLGPQSPRADDTTDEPSFAAGAPRAALQPSRVPSPSAAFSTPASPSVPPSPAAATPDPELLDRIAKLERQFLALSEEVFRLRRLVEPT